ncbi:hypothetical protein G7Z17_g1603 [Cylindrodendrum hubeiense]|uniref:SGNH hydrolase-type esterase domain-containing protein n=1 Tax=Cylindrodendrum hubeiense TaxID=595255 RepID=A0A9P5LL84_9HYPO|nr:hypothetical protein G7Z17_g1603 [Cylindrodendrum hubeiense]
MVALNLLSLSPLGLLILSASAVSGAPTPQENPSLTARAVPSPTKYFAFGDSFAAGIGAGSEFGTVHLDGCHRYDRGYPSALQAFINGHPIADENLWACTGAKADQVKAQAEHLDETVDLATISVGGNNVGFGAIINDCVYRFKGWGSGNCQATLDSSRSSIDNDLGPAVQGALQAFMDRPHHADLRIFVTGYAQFFNHGSNEDPDQCDGVSWNYWQNSPENGNGDKMTKDLRIKLNGLVVDVNNKIDEVVRSFNDAKIQFVDYDEKFDTHRFCEDRFTEPQRPSQQRLDLYMHQYYTPDGQFQDGGEYFDVSYSDEAKDLAEGMLEFANSHSDAKVATPFDEHPVDISVFPGRIPSGIMKVFHPTQKGHEQIGLAVWNAYTHESAIQPGGLQPLPEGFPIGDSGTRVSGNFPRSFVLEDSNQPVRDILYRMRDQACQGLCETVSGIPGDLLSHTRQGEDGCEFVTRISQGKQLSLSASHAGQNCWDATERMIEERMTDNGDPIYTESWVNGGDNEFYKVSISDFNNANIESSPSHHLGHLHVACGRFEEVFSDRYEVYISNWDDGDWGKSILNGVNGCHLSPTGWKYEDAPSDGVSPYTFTDSTNAQKWGKWSMVISNGGCAESKIEEALGLRAGGLDCPFGEWFELDLFK